MQNQCNQILNELTEHKMITSWDMITKYRITRTSAHIHTLRQAGHKIVSNYVTNGEKNWVEYLLVDEK